MTEAVEHSEHDSGAVHDPETKKSAIAEWAKKYRNPSFLAGKHPKKTGAITFVIGVLLAVGWIWYATSHPSVAKSTQSSDNTDETIANKKTVPELKNGYAANVPKVSNTEVTPTPATFTNDPLKTQQAQMELQRREQARKLLEARLKSAIIPPNTANQEPVSAPENNEATAHVLSTGNPEGEGAQDPNSRFARSVSGHGVEVSTATQIKNLDYKILQGKIIEAILEPRAVSDLPGMICAIVQRDVYSMQERNILVPWGSRVCGVYSAELRKGQSRLFVVWNTLRRPDGVQVTLDSPGADQLGTAGMGGNVDTHFAEIFGTSALLSIIGAGAATAGVNSSDQYNSEAYYRQSVQQAAAQTSQHVLQPYISMPPTVTVPAGSRIRIYVNKDLDFTAMYQDKINAHPSGVVFLQ